MRKTLICAASIIALSLAACSQAPGDQSADTADIALNETAASDVGSSVRDAADAAVIPAEGTLTVSLPQIAYRYDYRWQMEADAIGSLQRRHASLCEQQGAGVCQIIGMKKSGAEEGEVGGVLEMAVATRQARAFGALLEDEAIDAGAQQVSAEIASEELSKDIVDTEARVRARIELRDRLMEVLRTRKGEVAELVEAERSVAAVNEEIDQANSWLRQMKGRVAYSRVVITYETGSAAARSFMGPVKGALGSLGAIFGWIAALLILVGAVATPLAAAFWAQNAVRRRLSSPPPIPAVQPDAP